MDRKSNRDQAGQLEVNSPLMVIFEFDLFMFIFAAAIVFSRAFLHAAFAAGLIIVVLKAPLHQFVHAIMEMNGGTH